MIHLHKPAADRIGVAASVVCLIHCLLLPLAVPLLPLLAGFAEAESVHQGLLVLLSVCAVLAFVPGYRTHRALSVLAYGGLGVALLVGGALAHDLAVLEGLDTPLTVIGGVVLIVTHLVNLRLCRSCPVCREQEAAQGGTS
jgi:MerC mercury resistance protein